MQRKINQVKKLACAAFFLLPFQLVESFYLYRHNIYYDYISYLKNKTILGGNFSFLNVCQDFCLYLRLFTINILTRAYIQDILAIFFNPSNMRFKSQDVVRFSKTQPTRCSLANFSADFSTRAR